jgi:hypothetical protein
LAVQTRPRVDPSAAREGRDWWWLPKLLFRRPWLVTAVFGAVILFAPKVGGDLAAQEYHAWVFSAHGALLWNNYWYGGHTVAGYSLLFPPMAALVGTRTLGSLAAVAGAWAMAELLGGPGAPLARRLGALWFAIGILCPLVVGQLPFGIGVTLSVAGLLAVRRGHPWLAGLAALAASLTSPLAGAFLLIVALAWTIDIGVRRAAPLATAVVGVVAASLLGGGGYFPFPRTALLVVLLFSIGGAVLLWRGGPRSVQCGLLLYGLSAIAIFAVQNPVGGNETRLGALVGGPVVAAVLGYGRRWWILAVVSVPLLCWQVWPGVTALQRSVGDPSNQASYYTDLESFLDTQDVSRGRVEVPTLREHWEAMYVAESFPLARGWERQIDLRDNAVLYRPDLTANELHSWLLNSGVGLVALPDAPLDYWSMREGALIAAGQPWLTPVWSDAHWRVWRVSDSPGLVTGPAHLTALGVSTFNLTAERAGTSLVRVHWSPFWQVTAGSACLRKGPDNWLTVQTSSPGPVTVSAQWSVSAIARPATAIGSCA